MSTIVPGGADHHPEIPNVPPVDPDGRSKKQDNRHELDPYLLVVVFLAGGAVAAILALVGVVCFWPAAGAVVKAAISAVSAIVGGAFAVVARLGVRRR